MVLAASEDKTYRGAGIASPSMPWAWGQLTVDDPRRDAYHLVWSRDLYQVGTALIAAGDRDGAERALDFLFERQQKADGSFPQNSLVDGTPKWTNLQLDEVALPIVLAWQLRRVDAATYTEHVKPAADFVAANGPQTRRSAGRTRTAGRRARSRPRSPGWSRAADIARRNGDDASAHGLASRGRRVAGEGRELDGDDNGPYSPRAVLPAPDQGRQSDPTSARPTRSATAARGGRPAQGRRPELPRARAARRQAPDDPTILNTVAVVDQQLAVDTPNGRFWHRFNFDGYGETGATARPWDITEPDTRTTIGRVWPIFAGERGEYELLAGARRTHQLRLRWPAPPTRAA